MAREDLIGGTYSSHYAATGDCPNPWHARTDSILYICPTCECSRSGWRPERPGAGLRVRLAAAPADDDPPEVDERVAAAAWALIREFQDEGPEYGTVSRASVERLRTLLPPEES